MNLPILGRVGGLFPDLRETLQGIFLFDCEKAADNKVNLHPQTSREKIIERKAFTGIQSAHFATRRLLFVSVSQGRGIAEIEK